MDVSLILTTYNWPEALRITLRSVLNQSRKPEEILIADDGSGCETAEVVKETLAASGLKWRHIRHSDEGVRQSRIKNLAVRFSSNPYLIFVDHDCILQRHFIADHVAMAERGVFLQGKRSLLSREHTGKVISEGTFQPPGLWTRGLGNRKNLLRWPSLGRFFSRRRAFETSLRGCNLSMFRSDFLKVDGFDETFDGSWGREDSDICYRLFHGGLQVKTLWFLAVQYHLYHGITTGWERERLDLEIQGNLREKRTQARKGYSQLSAEGVVIAASSGF